MKKFSRVFLSLALIAGFIANDVGPSITKAQATSTCSINGATPSESTNPTTGLRVVKFEAASDTSDATCEFVVPAGITSVRVISVSGGGGGGWDGGGGGGGGGVNKYDNYAVTPGAAIVVKVGGGGAAATSSTSAGNGGTSSFNGESAAGGSGGGSKRNVGSGNTTGSAGGAGHTNNNSTVATGGVATKSPANINFENDGGNAIGDYGGGGGGATAAGGNATITAAGAGGAGFFSSIEGNGATYAGGGGGGTWKAAVASSGGSGGGGAGGTQDSNAAQGTDGLGGGGGGGGRADTNRAPGRGGSGVVLVSYRVTDVCTSSSTTSGGFTTVVFANTTSQISNCRTTWSVPTGVSSVDVLVLAGGGGGGGQFVAGGGGAGGYRYLTSQSVSGTITVQVGGGGKGGETLIVGATRYGNSGFDGGNSIFGTLTSVGGGGGGAHNIWIDGRAGGSGGGGGVGTSNPTVGAGGSATSGQGNAGAAALWNAANPGGGGGGFGSAGSQGTSTTGGAGGSGTSNPISGVSVSSVSISNVAAGGAGGSDNLGGTGGSSIGGNGGGLNASGSNATANTGSGGGGAGGGGLSSSINGGNGSAGLVVIKYVKTLNVTFNSQGGSAVSSTTVLTSATLSAPTTPTLAGYDLNGWSLTPSGSVVDFPFTHGQSSDFTLYAIWARNSSCLPTTTTSSGATIVTINPGFQTTSCSTTWTVPAGVTTVEMLVVGGGGSGAYYYGGGGGGGGVTTGLYSVTAGATLNVTVGGGGASKSGSNFTKVDGTDGEASSVTIGATTHTSNGGKAGIGCSYTGVGATFTCNSTNVGGAAGNSSGGAGGIGVYSTGTSAPAGAGTLGTTSTITGSSVTYGSGGDGGGFSNNGANGVSDTGSGGGGSGTSFGNTRSSGAGAAGVVIFRYGGSAPSLSGSFTLNDQITVGQTQSLNVNNVSITGRAFSTSYQWQKGTGSSFTNIAGATSTTYTIQDADIGVNLRLVISYTNNAGTSTISQTTSSVVLQTLPAISSSTISGTSTWGNTLSASASTTGGGITLTYQWSISDTQLGTYSTISGATNSTYTTTSADAAKWIKVLITATNSRSSASRSSSAVQVTGIQLSTPSAPTVSATSGSATSITVTYSAVSNASSHTVKVYESGVLVGSARTSFNSGSTVTGLSAATAYTVTVTAVGNSTSYTDSAESSATSVTTNAAAATPTISSQPTSATKYAGQSVTFSASATVSDAGSVTYQWRKGGVAILNATSDSYTINSVSSGDAGDYTVVATNTLNGTTATATSNVATLTFATATQLSTPSAPTVTATSGTTTSITVSYSAVTNASSHTVKVYASGVLVGSAQTSFVSGSAITGLTAGTTYTVTVTAVGDGTIYSDSAASSAASVTTNAAAVTPTISTQPTSATKYAGQSIDFTVVATAADSGSLSYQWKKNGTDISGATSATYTIASVASGDSASYTVVVTNTKNGTTATSTSNAASLIFGTATQLSTPTAPTVSATAGSTSSITISFSSVANASSYTVRVFVAGVLVGTERTNFSSGSTITGLGASTTYTVTVTAIGDGTIYSDSAASSATSVTTNAIAVAPTITSQPTSASKFTGQSVTFSVTATTSDSGTLSYQWKRGGISISGATSATYSISSLITESAGDYTVVVTNTKNGTSTDTTSNAATLTVTVQRFTVTYSAPDKDSGSVPVDSVGPYVANATVTLLGNTGGLTRGSYSFAGWRTSSDATVRGANSTFSITADTTFIAVWTEIFQLSFNANGGSGIMNDLDGPTVTIPSSTFTRSGYTFSGWNTVANGSGFTITVGQSVPLTIDVIIYAQWTLDSVTPTNTITFASISSKSYGDTFSVTVSASSGLTVTVSSSTTSVCTVSTLSVTAISVGTCTLVASQAGNGTYPAATSVTNTFTVGKKSLVITASDQSGTVGNSTVAPSYSQSGLVSGDAIGSVTYTYAGSGSTRYAESSSVPELSGKWILGTYKITPKTVVLTSGSIGNYSVTFVQGTLNVSGSSQKGISGISVKSIGLNKTTELLTGFSASTTSYAIYVESAVTGVTVVISRESGSLSNAQVSVNDSGFRKLTFTSNAANSGVLALPQQSNTITVKMIATDLSVQTYSISILRDQATSSATGGVATPTPTATPRPATQVISSAKFFVNSAVGDGSMMLEISMTPTFSTSTFNYTLNFTKAQSTTLLRTMFSDPGLTIRIKINQSAFRTIPSSGASTSLPLNTGANTAILRVLSADGTVADYTFTLNRAAI